MTYKLNPEVKKICAPIIVRYSTSEADERYSDGAALAAAEFNKNYIIDSLRVEDSAVVLLLRENEKVNAVNWVGEEAVSFF